jgi:pimeloyl-ACP methyl ester carboxylesterase
VNGLDLYYEIHGTGQPLVLLHGGFGTVGMFSQILPILAASRQVIGVELQGHGHTADSDRPLRFELMADDVAALIAYLGHDKADVCGYSLGGGVALQTAIRHPDTVRKLVVVSAACKREGWYAEDLAGMAAVNAEAARGWIGSPMHQAYASVAPNPENWPTLADKTGQLLREDYDWSAAVAAIAAPTLIAIGDADGIRLPHAVEMFSLRGGGTATEPFGSPPDSRLAILPGTTHFTILSESLATNMASFLDAPMPETTGSV